MQEEGVPGMRKTTRITTRLLEDCGFFPQPFGKTTRWVKAVRREDGGFAQGREYWVDTDGEFFWDALGAPRHPNHYLDTPADLLDGYGKFRAQMAADDLAAAARGMLGLRPGVVVPAVIPGA